MTPLIEVLMSTYDGATYVEEQVRSILAQEHRQLRLRVRDDGSRDGTVDALRELVDQDSRMVLEAGPNLGLPAAFFRLLDSSSDDADLFALADQDDVWLPDKLSRAATALADVDGPALYCARVDVVDAGLRLLYPHELPLRGPSFANALVQNIALGCTVVVNRSARDLVRGNWPRDCVMHDAWLYLVLAGMGAVIYDPRSVVLYRQHGNNTVGMGSGPLTRLAGRARRQLTPEGPRRHSRQDAELLRIFGRRLPPTHHRTLLDLLEAQRTPLARLRYALTGAAHRQTHGSNLVLRALQALGRV